MSANEKSGPPEVDVVVVGWNHRQDLLELLDTLERQKVVKWRLFLVDNASTDGGPEVVQERCPDAQVILNRENFGFARAANQGIDAGHSKWVFLCNPDLRLQDDFLAALVEGVERFGGDFGCGKLYRFPVGQRTILDSTGMVMTPEYRHLDRGAGKVDEGDFDVPARVFGATGAAAIFRREALDCVRVQGTVFDERFFAYREDADLCWRLRLAGRECVYVPGAVGWHRRRVTPERRRKLPEEINRYGVRNRFLMRWSNTEGRIFRQTTYKGILRDLLVFLACFTIERSSLPAFKELWLTAGDSMRRRAEIARLADPGVSVAKWFRCKEGYVEELEK